MDQVDVDVGRRRGDHAVLRRRQEAEERAVVTRRERRAALDHPAQRVAVGVLDLHHVGAAVGEQLGAVRAREAARQVDDPGAGQRPGIAHPGTVTAGPGTRAGLPRSGEASPFSRTPDGGWLEACRSSGGGDRGVDVGPGRAAGAVAGLAAARRPGRSDGGGGRRGLGGRSPHRNAVPDYVAAARVPTAALLANDPAFGPEQRERSRGSRASRRPTRSSSASPPRCSARRTRRESPSLFPVTPASIPILTGALVAGRLPDPARADEIVVDENIRDRFGLDLGATMVLGQEVEPGEEIPPQFEPADGASFRRADARRRHREVGVERAQLDAVERLLREVRHAHAPAGQRVRRPPRRRAGDPRLHRSASNGSSATR